MNSKRTNIQLPTLNTVFLRQISYKVIGATLLGFFSAAASINIIFNLYVDPLDLYAKGRSEKLDILNTTEGRYSLAIFGSSRVADAFDPKTFDARLSNQGIKGINSVNLGVPGGSQAEQYAMATRYIEYLNKNKLKRATIILELTAGVNLKNMHLVHPRAINLYNHDVALFVSSFTTKKSRPLKFLGRSAYALAATSLYHLNLGFLSSTLFSPLNIADAPSHYIDNQKLDPVNSVVKESVPNDVTSKFSKALGPRLTISFIEQPGYSGIINNLSKQASVNNTNVDFIYVVLPTLENLNFHIAWPSRIKTSIGNVPVIDLSAKQQLLTPKCWKDIGHLNKTCSFIATKLIADYLVNKTSDK
jgi:hypothetical protein